MRQILSVSLPVTRVRQIHQRAKKRGFPSASSYVQYLLKADEELIQEEELLDTIRESRREYKRGKSIQAKSMADLV